MASIGINDVFQEVIDENNRLLKQLLFANRLLIVLTEFKSFIELISHQFKPNLESNDSLKYEELCEKVSALMAEKDFCTYGDITPKQELADNWQTSDTMDDNRAIDSLIMTTHIGFRSQDKPKNSAKKSMKKNTRRVVYSESNVSPIAVQNSLNELPKESADYKYYPGSKKKKYKLYKCYYPGCHVQTTAQCRLDDHINSHTGNKPHVCGQCGNRFSSKCNLNHHIKLKHKLSDQLLVCEIDNCGKQFNTDEAFRQHQKLYHLLEKRFVCDEPNCQFRTPYKHFLTQHSLTHTDDRPFVCTHEDCQRRFKTEASRDRHIDRSHSEASLRCDWPGCEYTCGHKDLMTGHKVTHSSEYHEACPWPNCQKKFKMKHNLTLHMRIHKNEKRHACHWPGCSYRAITSSNLKKHVVRRHK